MTKLRGRPAAQPDARISPRQPHAGHRACKKKEGRFATPGRHRKDESLSGAGASFPCLLDDESDQSAGSQGPDRSYVRDYLSLFFFKKRKRKEKCPKTRTQNEFSDKLWRRVQDSNPRGLAP